MNNDHPKYDPFNNFTYHPDAAINTLQLLCVIKGNASTKQEVGLTAQPATNHYATRANNLVLSIDSSFLLLPLRGRHRHSARAIMRRSSVMQQRIECLLRPQHPTIQPQRLAATAFAVCTHEDAKRPDARSLPATADRGPRPPANLC